jgi:hypothetical protein
MRATTLICTIPLAAAALLVSACGGSGSSSTQSTATTAVVQSAATQASTTAGTSTKAHHDTVTTGVVTHKAFRGTGGGEINDDNPGNADTGGHAATPESDPCTLVSRTQAQAILGKPIDTPVDAPLGPTCIYRPVGAKSVVTVTVEAIDFTAIEPHIHNRTRSTVAGQTSYCGVYGQSTTFVPLADGRVLSVAASCAVGSRFAARAVPRLKS